MQQFVQENWGVTARVCEPLGNAGGFSGAQLWRVHTTDNEVLCLRLWPDEHPTAEYLRWIHQVVFHLAAQGFTKCPIPRPYDGRPSGANQSFAEINGRLWQLEDWMAGKADYSTSPSPAKLQSALQTLALFHKNAQSFQSSVGPAPAMTFRQTRIEQLVQQLPALQGKYVGLLFPDFPELVRLFNFTHQRVLERLTHAASVEVPIFPCLRDVWHDHVLFDGDEVSGLIDLGAMRIESAAGDIARLVGSLVGDDRLLWAKAIAAYEQIRPLTELERSLIEVYDQSAVLCSGMNWLSWRFIEKRQFEDWEVIGERIYANLRRLRLLAQ